jgi:hypothetical protein
LKPLERAYQFSNILSLTCDYTECAPRDSNPEPAD